MTEFRKRFVAGKKWERRQKRKYIRFFKKHHHEWDHGFFVDFLRMKLTAIGVYFFRFGVHEANREIAHQAWMARKELKNYEKAFENWICGNNASMATYSQHEQEAIKKAFTIIGDNIQRWWD